MTIHTKVEEYMLEMSALFAAQNIPLKMPPQTNLTLGTIYTELDFGKMITATMNFDTRFTNPLGVVQGGFITAAFDEVFGPLSYMAASRPVVTLELNTTFIRPFTHQDESINLRAELVAKSKSLVIMRAEAKAKSGKLVATATNNSLILSDVQLNQIKDRMGT